MVGGSSRRRGRLIDAEEGVDQNDEKKLKATSAAAKLGSSSGGEAVGGLGVMDLGPGDALVSLTASFNRRPPHRIKKQALASRYPLVD